MATQSIQLSEIFTLFNFHERYSLPTLCQIVQMHISNVHFIERKFRAKSKHRERIESIYSSRVFRHWSNNENNIKFDCFRIYSSVWITGWRENVTHRIFPLNYMTASCAKKKFNGIFRFYCMTTKRLSFGDVELISIMWILNGSLIFETRTVNIC